MWTGDDQFQRYFPPPSGWAGLDELALARHGVEAEKTPVLGLGVDDRGILGTDLQVEAIAARRSVPVLVGDAVGVARSARAAHRAVVLRSPIHVVERFLEIEGMSRRMLNLNLG